MENGRQKAMDYFSSAEGKKSIKSVKVTFGESVGSLKKSIPKLENFNSVIPHISNSSEGIEQIRKLNEESNGINEQIVKSLAVEKDEIKTLKSELKEMKESHKYDWIKELLIAIVSSLITLVLSKIIG